MTAHTPVDGVPGRDTLAALLKAPTPKPEPVPVEPTPAPPAPKPEPDPDPVTPPALVDPPGRLYGVSRVHTAAATALAATPELQRHVYLAAGDPLADALAATANVMPSAPGVRTISAP